MAFIVSQIMNTHEQTVYRNHKMSIFTISAYHTLNDH